MNKGCWYDYHQGYHQYLTGGLATAIFHLSSQP